MSVFGDVEPEDAWDASDPVPVKLANLARRARVLTALLAARPEAIGDPFVRYRLDLLAEHLEELAGG